jgi:hypothetical protein
MRPMYATLFSYPSRISPNQFSLFILAVGTHEMEEGGRVSCIKLAEDKCSHPDRNILGHVLLVSS